MVRTRRQAQSEEKNGEVKSDEAGQMATHDDSQQHETTPRKRKARGNVEPHSEEQEQGNSKAVKRNSNGKKTLSTGDADILQSEEEKKEYDSSSRDNDLIAQKIEDLIAKYGHFPLSDVGLESPDEATPETILAHVMNVLLLSVRISHRLARRALRGLVSQRYHDLKKLKASTWGERVVILDDSGYARYDHRAATELGQLADLIETKYDSDIMKILPSEADPVSNQRILTGRLKEIQGVGSLGAEIFISLVQGIWPPICPFVDSRDLAAARQIGLGSDAKAIFEKVGRDPQKMARLNVALANIRLEKHLPEVSEGKRQTD